LVAAGAQQTQQLTDSGMVQLRGRELGCWVAAASRSACRAAAVHAAACQHLLLCTIRPARSKDSSIQEMQRRQHSAAGIMTGGSTVKQYNLEQQIHHCLLGEPAVHN
jgi:hypothetical protein